MSRPNIDSVTSQKLYAAARRIADIFHANVTHQVSDVGLLPWYEDWRHQSVEPLGPQVHGLYLNFYYGAPTSVWTPWGQWTFAGSGNHGGNQQQVLVGAVMRPLSTRLFDSEYITDLGISGPTYAVLAVEGEELFEPSLYFRDQYLPYKQATAAWKELSAHYQSQRVD